MRLRRAGLLLLAVLATAQAPAPPDAAQAIRAAVHDDRAAGLRLTAVARAELAALYEPGGYQPLWVDASGRPTADAREALALFATAAADGLDPAGYQTPTLTATATALAAARAPAAPAVAAFDAGLSASLLRYLRHLHVGRVDPRAIGFRMTTPPDDHEFAASLRAAIAAHRVAALAAEQPPPLALYRNLRAQLARYRQLAADAAAQLPNLPATVVRPGDPLAGLDALRRFLAALGDRPGIAPSITPSPVTAPPVTAPPAAAAPVIPPPVYEGADVEAVKRFQSRHGLEADGIIGARTHAALRVPLTRRVRQIELGLERLRWLPHLNEDRFLAVNIPMFRLWVWDQLRPDGTPTFSMDVIVGRALNTQTPVFVDQLEYLIFRPYWNVPASIARGEILPAIARDPGYLQRHDMEIVSGGGDDARVVAQTPESLAQVRQGGLRVRQRPGPRNSLGLVKFIFPNDVNVYLHDTPAPQLFGQSRRDFSHGCVRVEDPTALAEWALTGQDGWDRDRILAAMHGDRTFQVNLARPIQVILFYITAVVMPEDGRVHFAEDIYRHDARLDRALGGPAGGSAH